jgi:hypothetical protein
MGLCTKWGNSFLSFRALLDTILIAFSDAAVFSVLSVQFFATAAAAAPAPVAVASASAAAAAVVSVLPLIFQFALLL